MKKKNSKEKLEKLAKVVWVWEGNERKEGMQNTEV